MTAPLRVLLADPWLSTPAIFYDAADRLTAAGFTVVQPGDVADAMLVTTAPPMRVDVRLLASAADRLGVPAYVVGRESDDATRGLGVRWCETIDQAIARLTALASTLAVADTIDRGASAAPIADVVRPPPDERVDEPPPTTPYPRRLASNTADPCPICGEALVRDPSPAPAIFFHPGDGAAGLSCGEACSAIEDALAELVTVRATDDGLHAVDVAGGGLLYACDDRDRALLRAYEVTEGWRPALYAAAGKIRTAILQGLAREVQDAIVSAGRTGAGS